MIHVLSEDDYKEFLDNVAILKEKGYDLTYQANKDEDTGKYGVQIMGTHDFAYLDKLMES
tara:strand:+ start:1025 stop:1204 length:180 start_codon:yes stop_codon:yes gene_type:complete